MKKSEIYRICILAVADAREREQLSDPAFVECVRVLSDEMDTAEFVEQKEAENNG
jgi:hypothetical protein